MNGTRMLTTLALATGLIAGASVALADESGNGPASAKPSDNASAQATVAIDAAEQAKLDGLKHRITDRGAKISAASRTRADEQLAASAKEVDDHATADQGTQVAQRLGKEFNMTSDAVMAEKTSLNASWGDLTIAHALAGKAGGDATVSNLVALKQSGMGWGQIAAGLGLKLGTVVSGVKANANAASGLAKAGSHTSVTHGASASAGANAGVGKGVATGVKVDAGVKAGGKIKP